MRRPTDPPIYTEHPGEEGVAIVTAVIMMILALCVIAVMASRSMNSLQGAQNRSQRVIGMAPVDNAINAYHNGLMSSTVSEATEFVPTKTVLDQLIGDVAEIVPNSDPTVAANYQTVGGVWVNGAQMTGIPETGPDGWHYTVRQRISDGVAGEGEYAWWQVYRVEHPNLLAADGNINLVVHFRGWVTPGITGPPSRARMVRVEFRPGIFADYQILTDGPLRFGNSKISGPIHTNGFEDESIPVDMDIRNADGVTEEAMIWAAAGKTPSCTTDAFLTSAAGSASIVNMGGCKSAQGRFISFLRTQRSFDWMRAACDDIPTDTIVCYPPKLGVYDVTLNGSTVSIGGLGSQPVSQVTGLLFNDDVRLSGFSDGRVTIAAERRDPRARAADINIVGDIGNRAGATGKPPANTTLGVIAEGNIVLDISTAGDGLTTCPIKKVNAALVAMSGAVTIPPQYLANREPGGINIPLCQDELIMAASMASHRRPLMTWQYKDSFKNVGFSSRDYQWDRRIQRNPPPFFPLTDQWQITGIKDTNLDCITTRSTDEGCR